MKTSLLRTLRILYHLARADFLERIRRYSFLIALGVVLWMGYLSASGQFRMRVPPDYLGVINSAWVGATMTITVSFLLGWIGFYLVKGSVSRDYDTGVGQIMAATPLSRPLYTVGKWASNFAVLGLMILLLLGVGIIMNLAVGVQGFNLWALCQPLLLVALPGMAVIAAVAVLFETVGWLRGGLGNVVYFFAFIVVLIISGEGMLPGSANRAYNPWLDFSGWQLIGRSISQAAQAAYPESGGGFAFSIIDLQAPKFFQWNGIAWTANILLSRLFFLLLGVGLALLAAVFFDRFNPARVGRVKKNRAAQDLPEPLAVGEPTPAGSARLTPLAAAGAGRRARFRFDALFAAEFKLLLKGQRWWWYAAAAGLVLAQFFNDLETTRILLIIAWAWPILLLSQLGCRENRYDTRQLIFSAPRPILNQLPAMWLSAFAVLALLGSGALARFLIAGATFSAMGWLTGAIFIPSLALACGVLTGSSKTFEVVYVLWMYILTQKAASLDFIGITPQSPLYIYWLLAAGLVAAAVVARQVSSKIVQNTTFILLPFAKINRPSFYPTTIFIEAPMNKEKYVGIFWGVVLIILGAFYLVTGAHSFTITDPELGLAIFAPLAGAVLRQLFPERAAEMGLAVPGLHLYRSFSDDAHPDGDRRILAWPVIAMPVLAWGRRAILYRLFPGPHPPLGADPRVYYGRAGGAGGPRRPDARKKKKALADRSW